MAIFPTNSPHRVRPQEDAAYQQYTEALRLQAAGDDDGADVLFRAVLASPAVADSAEPDPSGP